MLKVKTNNLIVFVSFFTIGNAIYYKHYVLKICLSKKIQQKQPI